MSEIDNRPMEDVIAAACDAVTEARYLEDKVRCLLQAGFSKRWSGWEVFEKSRAQLDEAMRQLHRIDTIWDIHTRPPEKPDNRDY